MNFNDRGMTMTDFLLADLIVTLLALIAIFFAAHLADWIYSR